MWRGGGWKRQEQGSSICKTRFKRRDKQIFISPLNSVPAYMYGPRFSNVTGDFFGWVQTL